ncbi:MAG: 1-acyl-sn-glycerol-3-phosphate acyltransferase [Pseudomonadales bacterium]|jgi:1-acyl-sn-glycerol-3-phosphate acyltransferase|nr:1-acyl-sn-glycerol-3-phosphate acyltransferase [Pseudomonadales bacterium]
MIRYLRSLLFYTGYSLSLIPHATLCVVLAPVLSLRGRYRLCLIWNRFALWWLRITCGVRCNIIGAENIPKEPVVVLSNHQSAWETVFLVLYFVPICPILKVELLKIPFFGWALKLLKPIAIDRSKRKEARLTLLTQGCARLAEGLSVLVFPEGTSRVNPGEARKFAPGGAELAIAAKAKVLPVAHDAGRFWPAHQFLKKPGTITVHIGTPIDATGREPRELTEMVSGWIAERLG